VSSAGNHDRLTLPRHHPGMDEHALRCMLGHKELNMAMDALHDGLVIGRTIQNSAVDIAGGISGIRSTVPRPSPKGVRDVTDRAPGLARSWRHDRSQVREAFPAIRIETDPQPIHENGAPSCAGFHSGR